MLLSVPHLVVPYKLDHEASLRYLYPGLPHLFTGVMVTTALTCLESICNACSELYELSCLEDLSARDQADLRSSIELIGPIGERPFVKNGPLVLGLTLLLCEMLRDMRQGTAACCTTSHYGTDTIHADWFQWRDHMDAEMQNGRSQPSTIDEIGEFCKNILDLSNDTTSSYHSFDEQQHLNNSPPQLDDC